MSVLVFLLLFASPALANLQWRYHNNSEVAQFLKNVSKSTTGDLQSRLYSIGKSRQGEQLWVLEVTAAKQNRIQTPNIKLIGTVHGNEPVGRELLLHFVEHLRDNYKTNPDITWLLENTRIHILPNLNPDGFAMSSESMCTGENGRANGPRGKDLNRNFPDFYHQNSIPPEPESRAVQKWLTDVPFILSAALHGGALVVNYPFETVKEPTFSGKNPPSLAPDDDVFVHLANVYAGNHLTMRNDSCNGTKFEGGITNGAAWYLVIGGMQDYNYAFHGCMELTLEISCCKYPTAEELPKLWEQNKMALVKYCLEALHGVSGQIFDSTTLRPVPNASLQISGRNMSFYSHRNGEFWRLLLPGSYQIEVTASGYYKRVVPFVVQNRDSRPELTFLNISLINATISTTTVTTTTVVEQKTTEIVTEFSESETDGTTATELEESGEPQAHSLLAGGEKSNALYFSLLFYLLFCFLM